jgi:calcineurin-like phosphoesterase family protein
MGKIWLVSDTHFGHNQAFIYESRGFNTTWGHDKTIIENWNNLVDVDDDVYHLGDVMLGDNDYGLSCLKQLKGRIHIIRGNHCTNTRMELYKTCWNVTEVCEGKFLRYGKYHFYLSHYPCLTSNNDDDKPLKARTISLCGHSHTRDKFQDMDKGLIYHCELDAHDNKPILIDDIIEDIKNYKGE